MLIANDPTPMWKHNRLLCLQMREQDNSISPNTVSARPPLYPATKPPSAPTGFEASMDMAWRVAGDLHRKALLALGEGSYPAWRPEEVCVLISLCRKSTGATA